MNSPRYYSLRDKKSASVNKLKQTFTAEIRAFCNEMNIFVECNPHMSEHKTVNTLFDIVTRAHELNNFAYYHLSIYTNSEWNYIDSKIEQALEKALDEVHKND